MSDLLQHYRQLLGIAKSWAVKSLPGWSDECHRDLLARHGAVAVNGRVSAVTLTAGAIRAALDDYERRGWPRSKGQRTDATGRMRAVSPQIAHIVRLWGKLGQAGKAQNASRPALLAFCARQTAREVPDLDSLTTSERQRIIEALKSWLNREPGNARA
ncbi:MAG: regulatory protein GemA [Zoogloeaceae bacterium]|jgi:hypothetical protein|nr:regulatory protein GemA [Zoogloeaceae bacterium]